jgi:hypothetical protein
MSTQRVVVISSRGKLVGTWLPDYPSNHPPSANGPRATLVAGPGQRLHEIEVENAEAFIQRSAVPELHKLVRKKLQLK